MEIRLVKFETAMYNRRVKPSAGLLNTDNAQAYAIHKVI